MANIIYGINPIRSAISSGKVKKLYIQNGTNAMNLIKDAKENNVKYVLSDKETLSRMVGNVNHQGAVAETSDYTTISLDELLKKTSSKDKSIIIMLDNIEDPHNLGAILRVADAFGCDGVIFKNSHQVGLNDTVAKVSTGAINYVDCVCVANLTNAINSLKENKYWIYGTDMDGKASYFDTEYASKVCIIIGSEGFGISRLVKENCDVLIKIPMCGHVNSLNASTATSIVISRVSEYLGKTN